MIRHAVQRLLFKKVFPTGYGLLDRALQGGIRPDSTIFVNLPVKDDQLPALLFARTPHVQYRGVCEDEEMVPLIQQNLVQKSPKTIYIILCWSNGHIYELPKKWLQLTHTANYLFDFGVDARRFFWREYPRHWECLYYKIKDNQLKIFKSWPS